MYEKWERSPIIVSFDEQLTEVSDIPFPAVTICPETKTSKSYLNITKMYTILMEEDEIDKTNEEYYV